MTFGDRIVIKLLEATGGDGVTKEAIAVCLFQQRRQSDGVVQARLGAVERAAPRALILCIIGKITSSIEKNKISQIHGRLSLLAQNFEWYERAYPRIVGPECTHSTKMQLVDDAL
eukprot:SAG31_NODE_3514_length_4171_cov_6.906925_2_plen_115_part_00